MKKIALLFTLAMFAFFANAQQIGLGLTGSFDKSPVGVSTLIDLDGPVNGIAYIGYGWSGNNANVEYYEEGNYGDIIEANQIQDTYTFTQKNEYKKHYSINAGVTYEITESFQIYGVGGLSLDDRFVVFTNDDQILDVDYRFMVPRKHETRVTYGGGILLKEPGYFMHLGYDALPEGLRLGIGIIL